MTISLNISTNQKDSGLNSLLLGQQSGQSADFDSQFEGELSSQSSTDRQDLAAATHGYDDYQQQQASTNRSAASPATPAQPKTAQTSSAAQSSTAEVSTAQVTESQLPAPATAETAANSLLEETSSAQGDILLAVISQSQAIKQLQSKTAQTPAQADTAADGSVGGAIKPAVVTTTDSGNQAATELAASVLGNASSSTKTNESLIDVPLKFRKLVQKPQQPNDPKPQVEQATSVKTTDEPTDDLALDAVSYWQLRQQQKEQTNSVVATAAPEHNAQISNTQQSAATIVNGESVSAATGPAVELLVPTSSDAGAPNAKSLSEESALANAVRSDKAATLVATAQETEAKASATAPTIEQPVAPIKAVSTEAGSAKEVPVTNEATVDQTTTTQALAATKTITKSSSGVNAQPSLLVARPPQEGAPVQKRHLLPSDVEIEPNKPAPVGTQPTEIAITVPDKAATGASRVVGEASATTDVLADTAKLQTNREPQWVSAEASTVAASVVSENSKATTVATERPAATDQKQTYAEFMQQSNQQQGEQQSQQQHKEQPAMARQLESTLAANTDSTAAVRATTVDAPVNTATAAVTSHAAAAPIGSASLTSHVNKLTETLKNAEVAQQQVPLDLQQPNAATKLAERVMYQVHQKIQSAEVQLHPEDLGAMQIKVSLQQDQLSVQFVVQQGAAKEALEQQMPRLKDMLQQQGMQLAEGQVEQRQSQQGEQRQAQGQSGSQSASGDDVDTGSLVQQGQVQVNVSDRAVDYYA